MTPRAAFEAQAEHCAGLGAPFMARLMTLLAARLTPGTALTERIFNWSGDPAPDADNLPLRLAAGLHAICLRGHALRDVYPPQNGISDDELWAALSEAFLAHEPFLLTWLDSPPQTNEVRRSAIVSAALSVIAARSDLPVELLELGCSGGLNLRADQFFLVTGPNRGLGPAQARLRLEPDWRRGVPEGRLPRIVARKGVDLNPLEPTSAAGRLRLLAYLWPDQPARIARTKVAIRIARDVPADIECGDAGAWLEEKLAPPAPDRLRVVFHTVAHQYFPKATQERISAACASAQGPLCRLSMEADGTRPDAAITLTDPSTGTLMQLGRASFHGDWIDWHPDHRAFSAS